MNVLSANLIVLASLTVTAAAGPVGRPGNPHRWDTRVSSVAVFKNGLGFFLREGDVTLRDGWCVADAAPPAMYGTFAVYSQQDGQAVDVVGTGAGERVDFDGVDAPATDDERRRRLETYVGLDLEVRYVDALGVAGQAQGRLDSVGAEFVILTNEGRHAAVPLGAIRGLSLLELPLRVHVVDADDRPVTGAATLGMAYVRRGITWIPEYTLRILDRDTAELTLRGTLVNEAEDLVHCDVDFMVGVPNFAHEDLLTPVSIGQVIRTVGAAIAPGGLSQQIAGRANIASNRITSAQPGDGVVEHPVDVSGGDLGAAGSLAVVGGAGSSDFTVYRKEDLTVRRGEKAMVTLMTAKVRFSHLYRWTPPERPRHFLVLKNDGATPWTTGPALCLTGGQPLSEDLLTYTPRGGQCRFPLTSAINLSNEREEREAEREFKAIETSRGSYQDRVTLAGTIRLRSFEVDPVTIEVEVAVPGHPLDASAGGALSADSDKLVLTEREGRVTWSLELAPGEERTLTYRYERYVRSG